MAERAQNMAKRVLIAQAVLLGGAAAILLVREMPGVVREIRIFRMVGLRAGSRRPR
ncbi:hypothetical protein ACFOZ0_17625 [Streptomyces yaanensis]|uniref:Uncharacterized protein n=1 Tax=Streptomyces yaanensis TaxID=1142239 RepID=A0ABV7SIE1_9ACTN|nr:hypothetical protein [Streptomyces sp. CGMCC 4.7035]WNB99248.1 hypothetical protein Q2K21_14835 [Streptomyces sp. CGMCC 4.7035]